MKEAMFVHVCKALAHLVDQISHRHFWEEFLAILKATLGNEIV